jgi:hypothetical protein
MVGGSVDINFKDGHLRTISVKLDLNLCQNILKCMCGQNRSNLNLNLYITHNSLQPFVKVLVLEMAAILDERQIKSGGQPNNTMYFGSVAF